MADWTLETVLEPVGPLPKSGIGKVAVAGKIIAVAWGSALDVYTRSGLQWKGQRVIENADCLAVSCDGIHLAVASKVDVRVYRVGYDSSLNLQTTIQPTAPIGPDTQFGAALRLHFGTLAIADPGFSDNVGRVEIYEEGTSVWAKYDHGTIGSIPDAQECFATPADQHFGSAVAITYAMVGGKQIQRLVIGKPGAGQACQKVPPHPGHVYVFERTGEMTNASPWTLQATLEASPPKPSGAFGSRVAAVGDTIVVSETGKVTAFQRTDAGWQVAFEHSDAKLELPIGFDGDTLAFGKGSKLDPNLAESDGTFSAEPALDLPSSGGLTDVSVDGDLMAAVDKTTNTVSVFTMHPYLNVKQKYWATINPMALVLGSHFIPLTLPDPPLPYGLREQLRPGIDAMSRRERRTAARAIRTSIELLSSVHGMLTGRRTGR
jgi:hypothetical protein